MSRTWTARLLVAAAAAVAAAPAARAGLLPVSITTSPEEGNYRWTYNIVLPTDMKLQAGNYFTIYDFEGYVPGGEAAPDGWVFAAQLTGPTPDRLRPNDNPGVVNLTWQYTGPTIPSGQVPIGNFWAVSKYGESKEDYFTARTSRTSDGLTDSNITDAIIPKAPGAGEDPPGGGGGEGPNLVPEPGTLSLAGLGLPLVGLARVLRRRRA